MTEEKQRRLSGHSRKAIPRSRGSTAGPAWASHWLALLQLMGGEFTVRSALGQGRRSRLHLPVTVVPPAEGATLALAPAERRRRRDAAGAVSGARPSVTSRPRPAVSRRFSSSCSWRLPGNAPNAGAAPRWSCRLVGRGDLDHCGIAARPAQTIRLMGHRMGRRDSTWPVTIRLLLCTAITHTEAHRPPGCSRRNIHLRTAEGAP